VFQPTFTVPTLQHVLALIDAVPAPGKRTVIKELWGMSLATRQVGFTRYSEVLNRVRLGCARLPNALGAALGWRWS